MEKRKGKWEEELDSETGETASPDLGTNERLVGYRGRTELVFLAEPAHQRVRLSLEEQSRLAARWQNREDRAALDRLIKSHLGLVVKIAMGEFRYRGANMADLIQEGNLGLTIAARRFQPNRGTSLGTYASYWIRAYMFEHVIRSHGPVRIGTTREQRKVFFGLGKARRALEREGREVTSAALAEKLGITAEDVESMATRLSGRDVSFDAQRNSYDGRSLGEMLAEDKPTPEATAAESEEGVRQLEMLDAALQKLNPRERAIITERYLIKDKSPATLNTLGCRYGITRERVRQIELAAMKKLRQAMRKKI